jgi:hypothetical protein
MTNTQKLQNIMAKYCLTVAPAIDMQLTIQDRYVGLGFKDNFSRDICMEWTHLDCTGLNNSMFASLKTGQDILNLIGVSPSTVTAPSIV